MIPPATPDLAGRPTVYSQSPAESYIPQLAITLRTLRTVSSRSTRSRVTGLKPVEAIKSPD